MSARPRLSLWKRALLHGLKTLVRKHPGAALHAGGAALAYAGREVAHEGADFAKEKIEGVDRALGERGGADKTGVTHPAGRKRKARKPKASEDKSSALLEKLTPKERRALVRLAPRRQH